MSDADLAEIKHLVRIGMLTEEQAKERERKGVLKQREDLTELAERLDRTVIFYEDNNLSAFKRSVKRKDFERMVRDLDGGSLGGVLAIDIDRVFRQPKDLERVIDCYDKKDANLVFQTLSGQNFDLSTADGRFTARIMVNVANKSSEDMSRRLKREMQRKAFAGEASGGHRAFGWEEDRKTLRPSEVRYLDGGAEKILDGDSIQTVTDWWRDEGVVGRTGKPFVRSSVERILVNPRNAGIRVYQGEPLRDKDGHYILIEDPDFQAPWKIEKWEAVCAKIASRKKKLPKAETRVRSLLSGILRCGACGARMTAAMTSSPYPKYRCSRDAGGCGNVSISRPHTEKAVRDLVTTVLAELTARRETEAVQPIWEKSTELAATEKEFEELNALWKAGKIKATTYAITREPLEERLNQLRGERAVALARPMAVPSLDLLKDGWEKMSVERGRDVIKSVLTSVLVAKHERRITGKGIDHKRLTPVFRDL
ncbi:recombinase family protein [Streptomyces sp. NPDC020379]|uniref:recombinase family protein n=1 Tax=Streptomyces sp. NPDC020379 TaxID=3365071 RepID=UPI003789EFEA